MSKYCWSFAVFFEGSEKKVEIVFKRGTENLLSIEKSFWSELVQRAKASILSEISNDYIRAYLLSESSLFVFENKILMITCGKTTLIAAVVFLEAKFGRDSFELVFYQRKNEFKSYKQLSSFEDDVHYLSSIIEGKSMRFGKIHSHHNLIFHSTKIQKQGERDTTTELLMYDICEIFCKELEVNSEDTDKIRDFLNLSLIFPGFEIDDFKFNPCGYSLNAILKDEYYTIHITPENGHSYISFETNVDLKDKKQNVIDHFVEVIRPGSFDLISFDDMEEYHNPLYLLRMNYADQISIGHEVSFKYFYKDVKGVQKPFYF
ncbi:S-adenosylmethionine decarboxylase proenzyme [bacterium]|nr:S-adenosylmethionine decarboxylase proenzyme [bacterium]